MTAFLLLIYLALCLVVASLARGTRMGYWPAVAASALLTPFAMYALILLLSPRPQERGSGVRRPT